MGEGNDVQILLSARLAYSSFRIQLRHSHSNWFPAYCRMFLSRALSVSSPQCGQRRRPTTYPGLPMSVTFAAEIKPNKGYGRISYQKENNGEILGVHRLG